MRNEVRDGGQEGGRHDHKRTTGGILEMQDSALFISTWRQCLISRSSDFLLSPLLHVQLVCEAACCPQPCSWSSERPWGLLSAPRQLSSLCTCA